MKTYGYEVGDAYEQGLDEADAQPICLREVSFNCTPDQLRVVAKFLVHAADQIETHGQDFGHEHLRHWWKDWQQGFVDVIVVRD